MGYQVGELIIGKVTQVKPYALFMSFEDGSKGLLHISEISDNYIRDIEKFGTVGDEMKVKILTIDENNGFLRVSLKQVNPEESYTTHNSSSRNLMQVDKKDFASIEEKLPEWIKETMKEIKGENNND